MVGVGQPLIRSTFKLLLQPFSCLVEMPVQWPIPCPSHRDDVPMVLLEQDGVGMRSPVLCPAHSPPVPQPSAAQQPLSCSSSASGSSNSAGVVLTSTLGLDAMSKSLWCRAGPCCGVSCFS